MDSSRNKILTVPSKLHQTIDFSIGCSVFHSQKIKVNRCKDLEKFSVGIFYWELCIITVSCFSKIISSCLIIIPNWGSLWILPGAEDLDVFDPMARSVAGRDWTTSCLSHHRAATESQQDTAGLDCPTQHSLSYSRDISQAIIMFGRFVAELYKTVAGKCGRIKSLNYSIITICSQEKPVFSFRLI